jgi:hypothetical protein
MACLKPNHGYSERSRLRASFQALTPRQVPILRSSYGCWRFTSTAASLFPPLVPFSILTLLPRQVLQDMSDAQRRLFLRFLTGSSTLPTGGLQGLRPPITVVRRESDNKSVSSDEYLPSVMTCVNYLKLPPYSSREVLQTKLHAAIRQGQAAFHLS